MYKTPQRIEWNHLRRRRQLINLVRKFVIDPCDLIPEVDAMPGCRGWVRSLPKASEARFELIDTPCYMAAQISSIGSV